MWSRENLWIIPHAMERLRIHHPDADLTAAFAMLNASLEVEQAPLMPVLGRRPPSEDAAPSRYFLTTDRRGVFVLERRRPVNVPLESMTTTLRSMTMVTYLRLSERQRDLADRLWPIAGGPVALSPTKKPGAPAPPPPVPKSKTPATDAIRACLSLRWVSADDLAKVTGFKARDLTETLCALKHAGEVEMLAGPVTHWRARG